MMVILMDGFITSSLQITLLSIHPCMHAPFLNIGSDLEYVNIQIDLHMPLSEHRIWSRVANIQMDLQVMTIVPDHCT